MIIYKQSNKEIKCNLKFVDQNNQAYTRTVGCDHFVKRGLYLLLIKIKK